jgi:hypothetical protein
MTPLTHHTFFMQLGIEVVDDEACLALKYRIALRDWSLARIHHRSDSLEVLEATQALKKMEDALLALRGTALVKYEPRPLP